MFNLDLNPIVAIMAHRKGASLRETLLLSAVPLAAGSSLASNLIISDLVTSKVLKSGERLILKTSSSGTSQVSTGIPLSVKLTTSALSGAVQGKPITIGTPITIVGPSAPDEEPDELDDGEVDIQVAIVKKIMGAAPLTIDFQSPIQNNNWTYEWDFGDETLRGSTAANPASCTYENAGEYSATLTITDDKGQQSQFNVAIIVQ